MATYVLIPGAGGESWHWHRVVPLLRERGHDVVAPDLPADDETAGFAEYADVVVRAIGDRRNLVVVGHSMGGFVAPMVCERVPVDLMVLVAAMVPRPGESGGEWWTATGQQRAMRELAERRGVVLGEDFDPRDVFFHDVPPGIAAEAMAGGLEQSARPFADPWPLDRWPRVPTRFLLCRDDRFFRAEWLRGIVRERLGIEPIEIPGGHCAFLSQPAAMAVALDRCWRERS